jgi:hypothetical protein
MMTTEFEIQSPEPEQGHGDAPINECDARGHTRLPHDAIAMRFCQGSRDGAVDRDCICSSDPSIGETERVHGSSAAPRSGGAHVRPQRSQRKVILPFTGAKEAMTATSGAGLDGHCFGCFGLVKEIVAGSVFRAGRLREVVADPADARRARREGSGWHRDDSQAWAVCVRPIGDRSALRNR